MTIDVCLADPTQIDGSEAEICSLPFGETEKKRLLAIGNSASRRQSVCALQALAALLDQAHVSPLPITREAGEKPCFIGGTTHHFNLSHTPSLVAAALADAPVGIDVERMGKERNEAAIVRRFFDTRERALWEANPTRECFYALWTKKEAAAKLYGEGLLQSGQHDCHRRTFRLLCGEEIFFLSLASEFPIEAVRWILPEKELTIDEVSN